MNGLPTKRQLYIQRIENIIWTALRAQEDIYTDRAMDMIDTSGSEGVNMSAVAAAIVDGLGLSR